ncbi:beta-galactosidase trimerization domain-containing protein [Streptomyces sp. NPDC050085]|uniref:beta-galactosidase trimerization domain-containing protein n=1 Tax=Streptomyces sp. NPDC050085 TaxID=3365600 RepID=UPI003791A379
MALLDDWDSWWALEISDGPSRLVKYPDVVLAPVPHLVKGDLAERLEAVAGRGGTVLTTFRSGRCDEPGEPFTLDPPGVALMRLQ